MTYDKPIIKNFNKAFEAARNNPNFNIKDYSNCFYGSVDTDLPSYEFFYGGVKEYQSQNMSPDYAKWFLPWTFREYWPDENKFTDVEYCITNTKKIVEEVHGPQNWEN